MHCAKEAITQLVSGITGMVPGCNELIRSITCCISGSVSANRVLPPAAGPPLYRSLADLLELKVAVAGDEDIKSLLSHFFQQRAVLDPAPPHWLQGRTEMSRQRAAKPAVETLIDDYRYTASARSNRGNSRG
ncbi:MAG TPA: hypothetical protein VGM66_09785 [Candidatus Udaeobacter sp.]|jgi:hypothetical protein